LPKSPDYASRTSFVSEFQKDFENMIDSYVREDERLYVFIDDLDRCDMSRASELMQAIMLLINDGDRIVFVLGMDRDKVAAGIGLKYKDYVPLLSHLEDGTLSSPRESHPLRVRIFRKIHSSAFSGTRAPNG
jgi:predicted KAP-like P-loop ATPase